MLRGILLKPGLESYLLRHDISNADVVHHYNTRRKNQQYTIDPFYGRIVIVYS